jgi:hypothetical protein
MQLKQKKRLRLQAMQELEQKKREQWAGKAEVKIKQEMETEKKPEVVKKPWDPLVWTRVPFGGVLNEFRQRVPVLKSDLTDGMNLMCMAAIVFIFCSSFAGAVAFGGLLGKAPVTHDSLRSNIAIKRYYRFIFTFNFELQKRKQKGLLESQKPLLPVLFVVACSPCLADSQLLSLVS